MPDYSNRSTKLTGRAYAWTATFTRRPVQSGRNAGQNCTGTYTTQPGATVGTLLDGLTTWWAQQQGIRPSEVALISYTLKEKR